MLSIALSMVIVGWAESVSVINSTAGVCYESAKVDCCAASHEISWG